MTPTREKIEKLINGAELAAQHPSAYSMDGAAFAKVLRSLLRERDEAAAREAWVVKELYRLAQKSPREIADALAMIANQSSSRAAALLDVVEKVLPALEETEFLIAPATGKPIVRIKNDAGPAHRALRDALAAYDGADNG